MASGKETQKSIARWAEETFGPAKDPAVLVQRAATELDELLKAVSQKDATEIGKETADVVILLMRVLELHGLELQQELDSKMVENRARMWRPKGDGTGSHIKEG